MRGIVISPEYSITNTNGIHFVSSDIDPVKLRQYVLYWDKIDFPDNNVVSIGDNSEIEYLNSTGVLQRTTVTSNNFNGEVYSRMQLAVLNHNNSKNEGIWSLAQPNGKLFLNKDESVLTRNLQVELYNSVPVPTVNVNLEDILNFKERRRDELEEFRCLMDEMYVSIMNSPDKDLSKDSAVYKLQNKIAELNKVMNESKIEKFLSSVKIQLDYSGIGAMIGAFAGHSLNNSIASTIVGVIGGTAISSIKVGSEISLKPKKIPQGLKDYAYLYYQSKELL